MNNRSSALLLACFFAACTTPEIDKAGGPICARADQGCACEVGEEQTCFAEPNYDEGAMLCEHGTRSCEGGAWSVCRIEGSRRIELAGALIAPPTVCNPCNPACYVADDVPNGGDLTPDNSDSVTFDPVEGGLVSTGTDIPDSTTYGVGGDVPFDLTSDPNIGVIQDVDGSLLLDNTVAIGDSIWIANTGEGTVSRFNVNTLIETGRFWTGPHGAANDPSRTTINGAGDAFVTGREGDFVTRISNLGTNCPDTNGDGFVTTSTDGIALAWGQDDCVLWTTDLSAVMPGSLIRAAAAQDFVDPLTGDVSEYVWVGGYTDQLIAQLDGATGAILVTANIGYNPYGFAVDGAGNLWVSTISNQHIIQVDTNRCNASGCPFGGVCTEPTSTSTTCVGAIKRAIPTPGISTYGITVAQDRRVWIGGYQDVAVYDPATSTWQLSGIGSGNWKAGIAADARGNVWTTGYDGVYRISQADPTNWVLFPDTAPTDFALGWGVAVDSNDSTWVIGRGTNAAWVFEPGALLTDVTVTRTATSVVSPYTYSDMTGQQLRLASNPRGTYVSSFDSCTGPNRRWSSLVYDVDAPTGSRVYFRVRSADTLAALPATAWTGVGVVPGSASPIDVGSILDAAGVPHGLYAEVEVALESTSSDPAMFVTPRVRSVELISTCTNYDMGYYQREYDGTTTCDVPTERPQWAEIAYSVLTPDDSAVDFLIRSADSIADLATATDSTVRVPALPDSGVIALPAVFAAAGVPNDHLYMRVRARLVAAPTTGETPIFYSMSVDWVCEPVD